jgi:hypothetical protein
MNAQRSAELQVLLEGVPLPATRDVLVSYARAQDAASAAWLEPLPEGEYERIDAVAEALSAPRRLPSPPSRLPRPESDKPPGGSAYLDAGETSGAVRPSAPYVHPPEKVIEQQSKLQKEQQERQQD